MLNDQRLPERGAEDARIELPALLTAAEQGQATIITRRGHPAAALVPMAMIRAQQHPQQPLLDLKGSGPGLWPGLCAGPAERGGLDLWLAYETLPHGLLVALDAATIARYLDGQPRFVERLEGLFARHAMGQFRFAISAITWTQVMRAVAAPEQALLAARYQSVLSSWVVVPVDSRAADFAATLCRPGGLRVEAALTVACAKQAGATALLSPQPWYDRLSGMLVLC